MIASPLLSSVAPQGEIPSPFARFNCCEKLFCVGMQTFRICLHTKLITPVRTIKRTRRETAATNIYKATKYVGANGCWSCHRTEQLACMSTWCTVAANHSPKFDELMKGQVSCLRSLVSKRATAMWWGFVKSSLRTLIYLFVNICNTRSIE